MRFIWMMSIAIFVGISHAEPLPRLHCDGARMTDEHGRPVVLKGCNLGNWLILESWMFGGTLLDNGKPFVDGVSLQRTLARRFGADKAESLMNAWRDGYIRPRDLEIVKSFGFNVVRLPVDYRLLQSDDLPNELRPDAFRWIDRALDMCEAAGLYVIVDLHGAPGGQSREHHTGEAGQNKLWASEGNRRRTVELWRAIAARYKDRSVVAAWDLLNEPYGDFGQDLRPDLAVLVPHIAEAIRSTGDTHLIYFPGALNDGIAFYGDPRRFAPVGFTEHYYPGMFGSKPVLETHARTLGRDLPMKRDYLARLAAPYLVGEFNVVLAREDPDRLMRMYFDRFADYGWAATMWSYKNLKTAGGTTRGVWYMATNAEPITPIDVATASHDSIEAFFASTADMPLAVYEPLRAQLLDRSFQPLPLARYEPLATTRPTTPNVEPPGYTSRDIGDATPGHTAIAEDGAVVVFGGGRDINRAHDAFRFVARPGREIRATIRSLTDTAAWAKAGVMVRWGDRPDAAMAMLNVFPDGQLAFMVRDRDGAGARETKPASVPALPVQLRLRSRIGRVEASYRTPGGPWRSAGEASMPDGETRVGLVACAQKDDALTRAVAYLDDASDAMLVAEPAHAAESMLVNGSFDEVGDQPDIARGWNRWGDGLTRASETKTIEYPADPSKHRAGPSGLWQDVEAKPGSRYAFAVRVRQSAAPGEPQPAESIELRLESVAPDGVVALNSQTFAAEHLSGDDRTLLRVHGTATSATLRVLVIITPGDRGRGGLCLDDATLTPVIDGH